MYQGGENTNYPWSTDTTIYVLQSAMNNPDTIDVASQLILPKGDYSVIEVPDKTLKFHKIQRETNDWMFFLLLGILGIWIMFYYINPKRIIALLTAFFNYSTLKNLLKDQQIVSSAQSLALTFNGLIVIAVFYSKLAQSLVTNGFITNLPPAFYSLLFTIIVLTGAFIARSIIQLFSGFLFRAPAEINIYLSINYLSVQVLGMFLFPIVTALYYIPAFPEKFLLGLGLVIIVGTISYRLGRIIFTAKKQSYISLMHIILYLCALEILPLLIIGKWMLGASL